MCRNRIFFNLKILFPFISLHLMRETIIEYSVLFTVYRCIALRGIIGSPKKRTILGFAIAPILSKRVSFMLKRDIQLMAMRKGTAKV